MTSTPQRRISSLRQSLKASTPNFTVQYGERRGAAMRPRILTIFIMRPMKKNVMKVMIKVIMTMGTYFFAGGTNTGVQVTQETKFCKVAPIICKPLVWNLLHVTLLAHQI